MKAKNIRYMANGSNNGFRMVIVKRVLPFYLFVFLPLLSSCTLETSNNGKLDGFWQLTQLDTIATGGITDMREKNAFWAVQMHLLEVKEPSGNTSQNVIFRFERRGDSLIINQPRYNDRRNGDPVITDPSLLNKHGIYHLREGFFVGRLDNNYMDLQSDRFRFHFRKY